LVQLLTKVDFEDLIDDNLKAPLTFADFESYIKDKVISYLTQPEKELVDLLKMFSNYRKDALAIYPVNSVYTTHTRRKKTMDRKNNMCSWFSGYQPSGSGSPSNMISFPAIHKPAEMESTAFENLKLNLTEKCKHLVKALITNSFIDLGSTKVTKLQDYSSINECHPFIFAESVILILNHVKASILDEFISYTSKVTLATVGTMPVFQLNELVLNELNPPYSYNGKMHLIKIIIHF
jgi:hypothetical protein